MVVIFNSIRGFWASTGTRMNWSTGAITAINASSFEPSMTYASGVLVESTLLGWKQRVQQLRSATTPFVAVRHNISFGLTKAQLKEWSRPTALHNWKLTGSLTTVGLIVQRSYMLTHVPSFTGATYQRAANLAIDRLYDKLRSLESPAMLGETLGEYRETHRMLRRPARGLANLTDYVSRNHLALLKKAKWNTLKQTAKSLSDLTLEWRFGVSPLIKDLESAAEALATRDLVLRDRVLFNVSGKAEDTLSVNTNSVVVQSILNGFRVERRVSEKYKVRYKGAYTYTCQGDKLSFNQSLGLTWREAIPTLYNLIPYSFLVDYFVNLDTFVNSVAVPWRQVAWCVKTQRGSGYQTFRPVYQDRNVSGNTIRQLLYYRYGHLQIQGTRVERSNQTSLPLPTLEWKVPSTRQLTNIVALLGSRLPVLRSLTKATRKRLPGLEQEYRVTLLKRGSMAKVPYPFHR